MFKIRQTPRGEKVVITKKVPGFINKEQFEQEFLEDFRNWVAERPRSRTNWYQSLREYANLRFNEAHDEEYKC